VVGIVEKSFAKPLDNGIKAKHVDRVMNTAKITRIELVDGSMLAFHLSLPEGTMTEDFAEAIGDVLNCITEGHTGMVTSFATETDLKAGDEITLDGKIIEAVESEGKIEETSTPERQDYRQAFAEKHGQKGI
jgi:hypothetical protein